MSVTTYSDGQTAGLGARIKSALKSVFASMIAAREAEARRLVAAHMALYEANRHGEIRLARKAEIHPAKVAYTH